ncbi:MAG TPA: DUF1194 domain-containing protein [Alphaproteobacteria bacterium]
MLRRAFARLIAAGLVAWASLSSATTAAATTVDVQLVLAADVSRSIDDGEFQLQRQGYAAAFKDPRVLQAIRSGPIGRIAVCFLEWSGMDSQHVIVDWTVIEDDETAGAFADALLSVPRQFANRTAIGAAIDFAVAQFARSNHESLRRTIDISGDGTNTDGRSPARARDDAVAAGITINGLVILSPEPMPWNPLHTHPPGGLELYYRENVVGGPGAFVIVVDDFTSFAHAITNKLVREIAGVDRAAPPLMHVDAHAHQASARHRQDPAPYNAR